MILVRNRTKKKHDYVITVSMEVQSNNGELSQSLLIGQMEKKEWKNNLKKLSPTI